MLAIYDEIEVDWKIDVVCFASMLGLALCYYVLNWIRGKLWTMRLHMQFFRLACIKRYNRAYENTQT